MSHTTTVDLEVRSMSALRTACNELGYEMREDADVTLFDGKRFQGTEVQIPGWHYPIVISQGKVHFDNYEGQWGDPRKLDALKQRYAVNAQKEAARARGYRVREERVGGKVKLVLER